MPRSFERAEAQLQSAISKIVSRRNVLNCRKNEVIFSQGDLAESLFYIQAGRVKLSVVSPSGKEATLSVFTENDLIGRTRVLEFSKATTRDGHGVGTVRVDPHRQG
jgi:CRP/FNR family transcriptional regulator, cyclic AMP receptor protein